MGSLRKYLKTQKGTELTTKDDGRSCAHGAEEGRILRGVGLRGGRHGQVVGLRVSDRRTHSSCAPDIKSYDCHEALEIKPVSSYLPVINNQSSIQTRFNSVSYPPLLGKLQVFVRHSRADRLSSRVFSDGNVTQIYIRDVYNNKSPVFIFRGILL